MRKALEDSGYNVAAGLFNTMDFGPAQSRNRAWVIAGKAPFNAWDAIAEAASYKVQPLPLLMFITDQEVALEQCAKYRATKQKAERGVKWKDAFKEICTRLGKATCLHVFDL